MRQRMNPDCENIKLVCGNLSRRYGKKLLFSDVSFTLSRGESLCVWGRNGSGKSTLLKILAGLVRPNRGEARYVLGEKKMEPHRAINEFGVVSPDIIPYDELSPLENLAFTVRMRGGNYDEAAARGTLESLGLSHSHDAPAGTMSSGMKQRLRLALATIHDPPVLLLDEPTSYLDTEGTQRVEEYVRAQAPGRIVVIATNNPAEKEWCAQTIELGN